MNENFNELDQMMGYDSQSTDIFNNGDSTKSRNNNIYRTSPKESVSDDGHYHSKVRLIYNPFDRKRSIVHVAQWVLQDQDGFLIVNSKLGDVNTPTSPYFSTAKLCPLFILWKQLHFSKDPVQEERAKELFTKREMDYILVQVIEDKNQPDMVGRILPWRLPKDVMTKLQNKMTPSKESGKAPVNVLDFLVGKILDIDVTPGPEDSKDPSRYYRETNYKLCEFDTDETQPVINVDGTPMFSEDEVEIIDKYNRKLVAIGKMKTSEEKASAYELLKNNDLYKQVSEMMKRASEYLKENTPTIVEEVGYKPWTPEVEVRVNRWIELVKQGVDPKSVGAPASAVDTRDVDAMFDTPTTPEAKPEVEAPNPVDDLPF